VGETQGKAHGETESQVDGTGWTFKSEDGRVRGKWHPDTMTVSLTVKAESQTEAVAVVKLLCSALERNLKDAIARETALKEGNLPTNSV